MLWSTLWISWIISWIKSHILSIKCYEVHCMDIIPYAVDVVECTIDIMNYIKDIFYIWTSWFISWTSWIISVECSEYWLRHGWRRWRCNQLCLLNILVININRKIIDQWPSCKAKLLVLLIPVSANRYFLLFLCHVMVAVQHSAYQREH